MTQHFDCTHCGHQFPVEAPATTTTCPACGATLKVPDFASAGTPAVGPGTSTNFDFLNENTQEPASPGPERKRSESVFDDSAPNLEEASLPRLEAPAVNVAPAVPAPVATPARAAKAKSGGAGGLFWAVLCYASLVTIVCAWLVWQMFYKPPHRLENLPDVAPPKEAAKLILVPENAEMPPWHTLEIGETRRFGNLKLKVLKVTKGPVRLQPLESKKVAAETSSQPVLELWLELTNVSESQAFTPIDYDLLVSRVPSRKPESKIPFRANNFVAPIEEKKEGGLQVLMYDFPPFWDYQLAGQKLGEELAPGETLTTYLATTPEGVDQLKGELIWRVHVRKGHHPESGRGVTTVFEVKFHSDQIQPLSGKDQT